MDLLKSKIFPVFFKAKKKVVSFLLVFFKKSKKIDHSNIDLDKKLVYSLSDSKIPNFSQIKYIGKVLTKKESLVVKVLSFLILINIAFIGTRYIKNNLVIVPRLGGEYIEGLVGFPKHINPLYASISDVDSDISKLVFSSLFKYDKEGTLINDLVDSYEISEDGKKYTLRIKENVYWHHNEKLVSDDIIFTFNAIKNPSYESPLRLSFSGVEIEKIDDYTIAFSLSEGYAAFLDILTFGILPEGLWSQFLPESASLAEPNLKPIGSGPFRFSKLFKDKAGNIKAYNLEVNEKYYGKCPFVKNLNFKFFVNFREAITALNENVIDGISYLPRENKEDLISRDSLNFHNLKLPQLKSIFFNQEKNKVLASLEVRQALAFAISKEKIVNNILLQEAEIAHSPIVSNSFAYNSEIKKYEYNKQEAERLLTEASWEKIEITKEDVEAILEKERVSTSTENKLEADEENKKVLGVGSWRVKTEKDINEYLIITLTTIDDSESIEIVETIKKYWEEVGIKVILNIVPVSKVQANIIKPRDYECLFFGQVVGNDPDSYVFWHSSQAGEGGFNLADYKNDDVDKLLEEARISLSREERIEKYKEFQDILAKDIPAIFIYSPFYTYLQNKKIKGFEMKSISSPQDRFSNVEDWYIKTRKKINF